MPARRAAFARIGDAAETADYDWSLFVDGLKTDQVKRIERIWRRGGLKVPAKRHKRERLSRADG